MANLKSLSSINERYYSETWKIKATAAFLTYVYFTLSRYTFGRYCDKAMRQNKILIKQLHMLYILSQAVLLERK